MKTTKRLLLLLVFTGAVAVCTSALQQQPPALSPHDKQIADAFEKRAKEYVKLREDLEAKMPKLSKEAKPEEIEVHKKQLQQSVMAARTGAKRGDIFTPDAATMIRLIIKDEFKGKDRLELRQTVLKEAEVKAVPLHVNYPYPETVLST